SIRSLADGHEQRASSLCQRTDAVVLVLRGLIGLHGVGEDITIRVGRHFFDRPEHRVANRDGSLPDVPRERELPVPLEQLEEGGIDELVVHQHAVEQLSQVGSDRPLPNAGIPEQEHDARLVTVAHGSSYSQSSNWMPSGASNDTNLPRSSSRTGEWATPSSS